MKSLLLALLICLPVLTIRAQQRKTQSAVEPCSVTIDQVPLIRGLRLGQAYEHLQKILPRRYILEEPDEYGIRRVLLSPSLIISPESLSGVESVSLVYFDDSLVRIEVRYARDVPWESNLHFVAAIAKQLNLPREGWRQRDPSYLICRGFVVEVAYATIMPTLRMVSSHFTDEVEKRKAEIEEKKRARFRP